MPRNRTDLVFSSLQDRYRENVVKRGLSVDWTKCGRQKRKASVGEAADRPSSKLCTLSTDLEFLGTKEDQEEGEDIVLELLRAEREAKKDEVDSALNLSFFVDFLHRSANALGLSFPEHFGAKSSPRDGALDAGSPDGAGTDEGRNGFLSNHSETETDRSDSSL